MPENASAAKRIAITLLAGDRVVGGRWPDMNGSKCHRRKQLNV